MRKRLKSANKHAHGKKIILIEDLMRDFKRKLNEHIYGNKRLSSKPHV